MAEPKHENPCMSAALEYLEQGLSVLPVAPETKKPLPKWKEFQTRLPTPEEVEAWWRRWPNAQLGFVTGAVSGRVVLDSDSPEGNLALRQFRSTVYVKRGDHCHAHYKTEKRIRSNPKYPGGLELKAEGAFAMLPPSTHPSGGQYEWVYASEDADELMPVFEDMEGAKFDLAAGNGNLSDIDLSAILSRETVGLDFSPAKEKTRNSRLTSMVGSLINLGHAHDDILSVVTMWNSRNVPPLSELEVRRTVKSVFRTHAANHPEDAAPEVEVEDNGDYDFYIPEEGELERAETFPDDLLRPGGVVQDLMTYVSDTVPVTIPHFDMAASLMTVGTLIGQKFQSPTGLRTNLYMVGIAPSGSGKNAAKEALRPLVALSHGAGLFGPEAMTGAPALIAHLVQNSVCGLYLDEFGHFLSSIKSRAVPMKAELAGVLTELYTSAKTLFVKAYADATQNRVVQYPHLSYYGVTTPARFWEPITLGDFEDGFLARNLFLFGSKRYEEIDFGRVMEMTFPPSLIAGLNRLADIPYRQQTGLAGNIQRERFNPDPVVLPLAPDAYVFFKEWAAGMQAREKGSERDNAVVSAIYARVAEKAMKLIIINAVGNNHMQKIPLPIVEWGVRVVDYLTDRLVAKYKPEVAGTDLEQFQNKIVNFILRKSTRARPGVTEGELRRNFRGRKSQVWKDTLVDMLRSGVIVMDAREETLKRLKIKGGLYCLSRKYIR